jgi:1-acyl-sn-glycerol-3-phosphate acyltransferase
MPDWEYRPAADLNLTLLARARSLHREAGLISTIGHAAWWTAVRAYLALWHRLEIIGREHLPTRPPFVLVANHGSHLDALVLASPMPGRIRDRVFPLAAADVFFERASSSFFAALMLNALPMYRANRGRHALADLRARLIGDPCGYILFPEGARSRTGGVQPFRGGVGMIVAGTSVPVTPCWLEGCFEAMPRTRSIPRPRKIRMRLGPPETFETIPNDRGGWDRIARRLEERVRGLGAPACPGVRER